MFLFITHRRIKYDFNIMNNHNFGSFSESWSFENDVPSGESISNNNRDYTPEFTTDQVSYYRCFIHISYLFWKKLISIKKKLLSINETN